MKKKLLIWLLTGMMAVAAPATAFADNTDASLPLDEIQDQSDSQEPEEEEELSEEELTEEEDLLLEEEEVQESEKEMLEESSAADVPDALSADEERDAVGDPGLTQLEGLDITYNSMTIRWKAADNADKYRVYKKIGNGSYKGIATVDAGVLSYKDTDVDFGGTYTYTVRAIKMEEDTEILGECQPGQKGVVNVEAPKVTVTANNSGTMTIGWNKVAGATGYRVFVKNGSGWKIILSATQGTSYTYSDVIPGQKYTFTVRPYRNIAGSNVWGYYDKTGVTATAKGTAPGLTELENLDITYNSMTISWKEAANADKYRIYRKTGNGSYKGIATVSKSARAYKDTGVQFAGTYTYTVRAIRMNGTKEVLGACQPGMKGVVNVEAPKVEVSCNSYSSMKISWNKVAGADGYRVFLRSGNSWGIIVSDIKTTSCNYNKVVAGRDYTFTVRPYRKADGKTVWGYYDKVGVTQTAAPAAPKVSSVKAVTGALEVSWNKVSGATGYYVYRREAGGSYKKIATVSETTYKDTGALVNTTYFYTVRAYMKVNNTIVEGDVQTGVSGIRKGAVQPALLTLRTDSTYLLYDVTGDGDPDKFRAEPYYGNSLNSYVNIYVDDKKVLTVSDEEESRITTLNYKIQLCTMNNSNNIYLAVTGSSENDSQSVAKLYQYTDGEFKEAANLREQFESNAVRWNRLGSVKIESVEGNQIQTFWNGQLGGTGAMSWRTTFVLKDGKLARNSNISPAVYEDGKENKWTALHSITIYKDALSGDIAFTLPAGEVVKIQRVYARTDINNVYVEVERSNGQKGWMKCPNGDNGYFEESIYVG